MQRLSSMIKPIAGSVLTAVSLALAAPAALANSYPDKPITIVVAYPAGQGTDVATRYLADLVAKDLGQPVVIDNRPGAGGNIGTSYAARAENDGYTLTMGTNATHVLNQFLYSNTGYEADKDFEPVLLVGAFPMVVAVTTDSPLTSVEELLAAVKADPRAADVAMPSTTARLVVELLKEESGVPLFGVPYKGSANALSDLLGGQIQVTVDTPTATRPHIAGKKLRPIGVTSTEPSKLVPGATPVASQGVPGFDVTAWNALFAPKGTPQAVIDKLNKAFNDVLSRPETQARLLEMGFEVKGGTPADLDEFTSSERVKWEPVIEKAGLKIN
ncbi:Bug family tripartite tricarboxylate transporter substrate binding protein [Orrella marina]|nr:tripartite tricarboxylate transporter substrate binding protein [Orrella marina]